MRLRSVALALLFTNLPLASTGDLYAGTLADGERVPRDGGSAVRQ